MDVDAPDDEAMVDRHGSTSSIKPFVSRPLHYAHTATAHPTNEGDDTSKTISSTSSRSHHRSFDVTPDVHTGKLHYPRTPPTVSIEDAGSLATPPAANHASSSSDNGFSYDKSKYRSYQPMPPSSTFNDTATAHRSQEDGRIAHRLAAAKERMRYLESRYGPGRKIQFASHADNKDGRHVANDNDDEVYAFQYSHTHSFDSYAQDKKSSSMRDSSLIDDATVATLQTTLTDEQSGHHPASMYESTVGRPIHSLTSPSKRRSKSPHMRIDDRPPINREDWEQMLSKLPTHKLPHMPTSAFQKPNRRLRITSDDEDRDEEDEEDPANGTTAAASIIAHDANHANDLAQPNFTQQVRLMVGAMANVVRDDNANSDDKGTQSDEHWLTRMMLSESDDESQLVAKSKKQQQRQQQPQQPTPRSKPAETVLPTTPQIPDIINSLLPNVDTWKLPFTMNDESDASTVHSATTLSTYESRSLTSLSRSYYTDASSSHFDGESDHNNSRTQLLQTVYETGDEQSELVIQEVQRNLKRKPEAIEPDDEWSLLSSPLEEPARQQPRPRGPPIQFHGRVKELCKLKQAYLRSKNRCEIVIVDGVAGVGKTAICQHFFDNVHDATLILGYAKFEPPIGTSPDIHPYGPICTAFASILRQVTQRNPSWIQQHLPRDLQIALQRLRASFCEFSDLPQFAESKTEGRDDRLGFRQLAMTFRNILRVICCQAQHHVVFYLDDLQWLTPQAAEALRVILAQTRRFMFVATRRPSNYFLSRKLEKQRRPQTHLAVKIDSHIRVEHMDVEAINALLLQHFDKLDEIKVLSLAEQLHNHSLFLIVEFLRLEGTCGVMDHPFELVQEILETRMHADTRCVLLFASFLASQTFDAGILLQVFNGQDESSSQIPHIGTLAELERMLSDAVTEGLLVKLQEPRMYIFSHNIIWESLRCRMLRGLSASDRQYLHHYIGQRLQLYQNREREYANVIPIQVLNLAVQHCNYDTHLIMTDSQRIELIEMNLVAARAAIEVWSFESANQCLMLAQSYFTNEVQYSTMLRLTSLRAQCLFSARRIPQAQEIAKDVLEQARSLDVKCQIYLPLIDSMLSQGRASDAINANLDILEELKCPLPRTLPKIQALKILPKIKKRLATMTPTEWLQMEPSTDKKIEAGQGYLFTLVDVATRAGNSPYRFLAMLMGIQTVVEHGGYVWVSMALASAAAVMVKTDDVKEARRYFKLCLRCVQDRPQCYAQNRQALSLVYTCVNHTYRPIQDTLDGLAHCYSLSLQAGDFEALVHLMVAYSLSFLYSGLCFRKLQHDLIQFLSLVEDYGSPHQVLLLRPILQLLMNLSGEGGQQDATFFGYVLDESHEAEIANSSFDERCDRAQYVLRHCRMLYAYLMNDAEVAVAMSSQMESANFKMSSVPWLPQENMLHGLIAVRWGQKRKCLKWSNLLDSSAARGSIRCRVAKQLLLAEAMITQNKEPFAIQAVFDTAVELSQHSGNNFASALGSELIASYFEAEGIASATVYLQRSHAFYAQWGATRKCAQLQLQDVPPADASIPPVPDRLPMRVRETKQKKHSSSSSTSSIKSSHRAAREKGRLPDWMQRFKRGGKKK